MPFDVRHPLSVTSGKGIVKGIVNYLCWTYPLTSFKHSRAKKHIPMRKCLKFEPSYIIKIFNNFNNNGQHLKYPWFYSLQSDFYFITFKNT